MKKFFAILLAATILSLTMSGALAQTVRFEGGTPSIELMDSDGDRKGTVSEAEIILLGAAGDDWVEVYAGGVLGYVTRDALGRISPELAALELPSMGDLEDIDQDSDADEVVRLQRALISLGYLNGSADGSFGSMSANAVSDFQTAVGLQATGVATPITQQLLFSLAGTAKVVRIYGDPSKQFAAIEGKCAADLSSVKGIATVFEYDDISGSGFISNGNSVVSASTGGADIDSYAFTVVFGFSVSESKGEVAVRPAVRIVSESVRRPIMQKLTFKSGDAKASIKVRNLENSVSGSRSVESSTVNLNEEISALLAAAADAGELKVRIEGKYQNYDIEVPAEQLSLIAKAGAAMGELLAQ